MANLKELIKNKKAKVAIMGLGYVGLPHAVEIAKAGFQVLGFDIQKERVDKANRGESYIKDVKNEDLKSVLDKFKAFNNFEKLEEADVILICVPTPLDKYKVPDISYIKNSCREIKESLKKPKLIVLESTTYPGTTEEVILPILEKGRLKVGEDFYLAFAPERIDPGNKTPIREIPKIIGGITEGGAEIAKDFYEAFLEEVHKVSSPKVAEMAKLLENTYRLVNISMINELAALAGKMGIDIWEVIEAAKTKPYGFNAFYPSPKVGGHCIPLDPFYLSYKAKEYNLWARFIELSGEINERMPHRIVVRATAVLNGTQIETKYSPKPVKGSNILIWGVSYKKDVADARESGALNIISILKGKGARVDFFDPYIKEIEIGGEKMRSIDYLPEKLGNYDLLIITADHSGFDYDEIAENSKLVVDTRNAIKSRRHKNVSWW